MGSLILSRAEGTLGRGRLELSGWLFPFGRTLSLSKSAISKARLRCQGIRMPQQPIKIFPDDLSGNATGRFQSIQKSTSQKNHTACARHDLREGDKMVCKNTWIPALVELQSSGRDKYESQEHTNKCKIEILTNAPKKRYPIL